MTNSESQIRSFDSISVGEMATIEHKVSEKDILSFAKLSGDQNPLHVDSKYAKETVFGKQVVHGMFLGSLISQIIGMRLPGKYSLLLTETLEFKKPAFIEDEIAVFALVKNKIEATKTIELSLQIKRAEEVLVSGSAMVKVLL
jgi:3-hydroxybutyryl-CoA dehydratase